MARYSAIGRQAIPGANNGDDTLCLGDGGASACPTGAEYEPCPNVNIVNHLFEDAPDPVAGGGTVRNLLAVAPCGHDPFDDPIRPRLDYLIINEFEQRLTVRKEFSGLQIGLMSSIDPFAFSFGLQGTLAGHTRISSVNGSNVEMVALQHNASTSGPSRTASAGYDVVEQGFGIAATSSGRESCRAATACSRSANSATTATPSPTTGARPAASIPAGRPARRRGARRGAGSHCAVRPPPAVSTSRTTPAKTCVTDSSGSGKGGGGPSGLFDNPAIATDYTLCVYEGASLALRLPVVHGGTCGDKPCWKSLRRGFRYRNPVTNAVGVGTVKVVEGRTGGLQLQLPGKGAALPLPGPGLPNEYVLAPVSAALVKRNAPRPYECWEAEYATVQDNTGKRFRATVP